MKKNDIFTFTAPNGVDVTGVCLYLIFKGAVRTMYVCYAQNRLFTMLEELIMTDRGIVKTTKYHELITDNAVLPDYDKLLTSKNL